MPHEGNSGQRKGVKSERCPVMGRIAFQDLRHSERKQTYTVVSVCKESGNDMNKEEVYTSSSRTANLDATGKGNRNSASLQWETIDWFKVERFINKAQARIAKAAVKGKKTGINTPGRRKPRPNRRSSGK